jgi:DNA-binding LacI/PurR family transcriptional regulator
MEIKAATKAGVPEKTYEKIYAKINKERWPAGTKLQPIHELAKEYEVSYLTAQRAIRMLQQDGILVSRRGDGTYVTGKSTIENDSKEDINSFKELYSSKNVVSHGKSRTTHFIGIVMPYWMSDICGAVAFHRIIRGFLGHIDHHKWPVDLIYNTYHEAAKPDFLDKILQKHLDGIFWLAPQPEHQMNIMRLIDRGIAVTSVGRIFPDLPFNGVFVNITDMAKKIADFCCSNNSNKTLLLTSPIEGELQDANSAVFARELRKALEIKNIKLPDDCIGQAAIFFPRNKLTEVLTLEFLKRHPDADTIIAYHETFFPSIENLDKQNFWENPESMVVIDVNGEFVQNKDRIGRIPVTRLAFPLEDMGLAAAIELERKWLSKDGFKCPDLSVKLIPPS